MKHLTVALLLLAAPLASALAQSFDELCSDKDIGWHWVTITPEKGQPSSRNQLSTASGSFSDIQGAKATCQLLVAVEDDKTFVPTPDEYAYLRDTYKALGGASTGKVKSLLINESIQQEFQKHKITDYEGTIRQLLQNYENAYQGTKVTIDYPSTSDAKNFLKNLHVPGVGTRTEGVPGHTQ